MKKYTLENEFILVEFLDLGGCITKLEKKNNQTNFVLHYSDSETYQSNPYFLGATIGRNAGRTFQPYYLNSDEKQIRLDTNEGDLHLHGGKEGLQFKQWSVKKIDETAYRLSYFDTDSVYEDMDFTIYYRLEGNTFIVEMHGNSEQPTICNLTNHSYFNLNHNKKTIENHWLTIDDAEIQLIDAQLVPTQEYVKPTGEYESYNFQKEVQIKKALGTEKKLAKLCGNGINLAYRFTDPDFMRTKIKLKNDTGDNRLTIRSNQEACVVYTLNSIDKPVLLNREIPIEPFMGITFEMQQIPNYDHEKKDHLCQKYSSITTYEIN